MRKRITEQEALKDIKQRFIAHPALQIHRKFSASEASGGVALAWYRGHHTGALEAFDEIAEQFPQIRKKITSILGYSVDDNDND